ncbi:MAG TPA: Ig-like domain-containing protein, partial [Chitinophagaceae bacterium]|nr:Ig-like domain-containing protein [Chitinophagaceae bacterium]
MKKMFTRAAGIALAQLLALYTNAQLADNFSDGDFSNNPAWGGNTADWIVNTALRLQSNNTVANSSFYLSTPSTVAAGTQWELYVQLAFNTSSANYVDIYLAASAANIGLSNTTGYFVRLGNTSDDICLYRKDASGLATLLIDGLDGVLNTSNNILKIKVTRNSRYQWTLMRDAGATGNYISEGTTADSVYRTSSFFGLLVKQSTAGFFQKHFFDDIEIKPYAPDTIPPAIVSAAATATNALDLLFSEAVDPASSQATGNYFTDNGIGFPASAVRDAANNALVHLLFANPFPNGTDCHLTASHVKDLSGNALTSASVSFGFYTVQQYDVVIDEIMADPNPPVALPPYEFIELKNVSAHSLDLYGWQVGDSTGFATISTHV